jgi:L-asparaginase
LENSVKAIIQAHNMGIAEVMIVFSDRILRAARAIKTSEARFLAFDSPAFQHMGSITALGIEFANDARRKNPAQKLEIKPHFQRGILAVDLVPGLEPGILLHILRSGRCQGLLLKSLGAGNVPSMDDYSLIPVIKEATESLNIPVLVSTKFVGGNTHMDIYEPGKQAMAAGAIPTGDMTDVMAQVKFMWALAQGYRRHDELQRVMLSNFVGEVTGLPAA